jgi:hypothetical protein
MQFLQRRVLWFPNRRRKESNNKWKDSATVFDLTESLSSRTEVRDLWERSEGSHIFNYLLT